MKKMKFALAAGLSSLGASVMAAIDTSGVKAGIEAAQGSAETTGAYVITAVAALVVVGLIIGMVKKM